MREAVELSETATA
uniref:Uncharacterized protein n=1 Tax=Anguilla anguilla TaxID=7936 RepID=A0A0E9QBZ9_ANGAN